MSGYVTKESIDGSRGRSSPLPGHAVDGREIIDGKKIV